ncbi:hypothetical protein I4U23_016445 [Adineta vaga]|nr:hypothetical protein I4U23_016445 [Adineta vaga]
MSSESDFIALLTLAQQFLYKLGGPILMGLGTVSCILSLVIFTKKNLRKNPCSIYFVAYNTVSLLGIYTVILPQTLSMGYNIDPTLYNLTLCRFRFYALLLFDILGPSYIILASVDRVLVTSRNALTRQRSTHRFAYLCITCVTLFCLLAESHTFALVRIQPTAPGVNFCFFQFGNYYRFISYYTAIVKGILIPLLMLIFGLWTIKNVRNIGRVGPVFVLRSIQTTTNTGMRAIHSKDRLLIRIVLADTSVYLFFSLMLSILLVYGQISPISSKSVVDSQVQKFMIGVSTFFVFIPFCITFYNNLFVSKTFRHEAKNILMCK